MIFIIGMLIFCYLGTLPFVKNSFASIIVYLILLGLFFVTVIVSFIIRKLSNYKYFEKIGWPKQYLKSVKRYSFVSFIALIIGVISFIILVNY